MELFIRIKDGQPFEHPIFGDNFIQAFPDIDIDNLPINFAKFERIEKPIIGVYEIYEGVTYERFDKIIKDVHIVRSMTESEKSEKITQLSNIEMPEGWVFNEILGIWEQTK